VIPMAVHLCRGSAEMLWMAVAEVDVLRREGIASAEALLNAGVKVTVKEYEKNASHAASGGQAPRTSSD
jgi:acetyl esterase/lipase